MSAPRRNRWQDPKIQTRADVARPFYFIRPFVPTVTAGGIIRKQKSLPLGFLDEIDEKEAQSRKSELMNSVNTGTYMSSLVETKSNKVGSRSRRQGPLDIRRLASELSDCGPALRSLSATLENAAGAIRALAHRIDEACVSAESAAPEPEEAIF